MKERRFIKAINLHVISAIIKPGAAVLREGSPRTIHTDDKEPLRQKMREKDGARIFKKRFTKKRKKIVEPVFGQIKNSGFRGFSLRGDEKVKGEFSLVCSVHNFRKIVKGILRGKVCLESGQLAPMVA